MILIANPHMNDRLIENLILLNDLKINILCRFRTHDLGAVQVILKYKNLYLWSYLILKIEKIEKIAKKSKIA